MLPLDRTRTLVQSWLDLRQAYLDDAADYKARGRPHDEERAHAIAHIYELCAYRLADEAGIAGQYEVFAERVARDEGLRRGLAFRFAEREAEETRRKAAEMLEPPPQRSFPTTGPSRGGVGFDDFNPFNGS